MIDLASSDVREPSRVIEELMGTREALEYDTQVLKSSGTVGQPAPTMPDSMVSTGGILLSGKYRMAAVTKEILSLVYGQKSINHQDLIRLRAKIRAVVDELKAGISKIPCTPLRTVSNFTFHQRRALRSDESQFDNWARLYMTVLTHRSWMLACHPVLKKSISEIWRDIEPEYVSATGWIVVSADLQPEPWDTVETI